MNQILEHLWLGSFDDAEQAHVLPMPHIEMLLTLCESPVGNTPLPMIHLPIPDEVFLPGHIWEERVQCLAHLLSRHTCTLVHCRVGVSRSPALVAAYLAHGGMMPDVTTALRYVMGRRSVVKVHEATFAGVEAWWNQRQQHQGEDAK